MFDIHSARVKRGKAHIGHLHSYSYIEFKQYFTVIFKTVLNEHANVKWQ